MEVECLTISKLFQFLNLLFSLQLKTDHLTMNLTGHFFFVCLCKKISQTVDANLAQVLTRYILACLGQIIKVLQQQ